MNAVRAHGKERKGVTNMRLRIKSGQVELEWNKGMAWWLREGHCQILAFVWGGGPMSRKKWAIPSALRDLAICLGGQCRWPIQVALVCMSGSCLKVPVGSPVSWGESSEGPVSTSLSLPTLWHFLAGLSTGSLDKLRALQPDQDPQEAGDESSTQEKGVSIQ